MKLNNSKLVIRQLDEKIRRAKPLQHLAFPENGWIRTIRTALNMSLRQLGNKMSMTPQSVRAIEQREKEGTLTINTLKDAASALNMKLVYGFIPNDGSLEKMIENKAHEIAVKIVQRTSVTMKLEDQGNSDKRIVEAINELADEIKKEMPKKLWD